jgi:hypothetical protein
MTLLREDAASLVVLFVLGFAGPTVIAALMVVGTIPGVVGGSLMLLWPTVTFLVNLWGYYWIDERKHREKVATLAITEMPHLASEAMALRSRPVFSPVERSRVAEVFALYWQARRSLETEKNPACRGDDRAWYLPRRRAPLGEPERSTTYR